MSLRKTTIGYRNICSSKTLKNYKSLRNDGFSTEFCKINVSRSIYKKILGNVHLTWRALWFFGKNIFKAANAMEKISVCDMGRKIFWKLLMPEKLVFVENKTCTTTLFLQSKDGLKVSSQIFTLLLYRDISNELERDFEISKHHLIRHREN